MAEQEPIFGTIERDDYPKHACYSPLIYPLKPGVPVQLPGIVGEDETGKLVDGGVEAETECILAEVKKRLEAIGLSLRNVMHVRVMIDAPVTDDGVDETSDTFKGMNVVYNRVFAENDPPATRDTVGGCKLLHRAKVEMIVTAWKPFED